MSSLKEKIEAHIWPEIRPCYDGVDYIAVTAAMIQEHEEQGYRTMRIRSECAGEYYFYMQKGKPKPGVPSNPSITLTIKNPELDDVATRAKRTKSPERSGKNVNPTTEMSVISTPS